MVCMARPCSRASSLTFSPKESETDAMNLILTGLRGTGKSSIGRRLARVLRRPFFDTDLLIEQQIGEPISQYVGRLGWDAFRDLEHQVICQVARQRAAVISSGGGALTFARNVEVLKPSSIIILLAADPAKLAKRLERSYARPPLTDAAKPGSRDVCPVEAARTAVPRGLRRRAWRRCRDH